MRRSASAAARFCFVSDCARISSACPISPLSASVQSAAPCSRRSPRPPRLPRGAPRFLAGDERGGLLRTRLLAVRQSRPEAGRSAGRCRRCAPAPHRRPAFARGRPARRARPRPSPPGPSSAMGNDAAGRRVTRRDMARYRLRAGRDRRPHRRRRANRRTRPSSRPAAGTLRGSPVPGRRAFEIEPAKGAGKGSSSMRAASADRLMPGLEQSLLGRTGS